MLECFKELTSNVTGTIIKYEKWGPQEYVLKSGETKTKYDFEECSAPLADFIKECEEYVPKFLQHHDLAVWQDEDWAATNRNLPRGHFTSVQDFSNSYKHEEKSEHQSQFFHSITSTLYGCVVRCHMADVGPGFLSDSERAELLQGFVAHQIPVNQRFLTFTIGGISPDPHHDNAFVQTFNEKLAKFMNETVAAPGVTFTTHHARSDGCKAQFKCAGHFLYVSRYQTMHGIRLDWCFSCSCHGKDLSDPEMGRCKFAGREQKLRHTDSRPTKMVDSHAFYAFLNTQLLRPNVPLIAKKMVGIWRRIFWFIPTKGLESVSRRLPTVQSLVGSAALHQFEDIGVPGFLRVRARSCHQCPNCWDGKPEGCENVDMVGAPSMIELRTCSDPDPPLTRSSLASHGIQLSADLEEGDFITVEVDSLQEPWMVGRCLGAAFEWTEVQGDQYYWMGRVVPGDRVVWVEKLEGDSKVLTVTLKRFPVFVQDIRSAKFTMEQITTRVSARQASLGQRPLERFKLNDKDKAYVLTRLPFVLDVPTRGRIESERI